MICGALSGGEPSRASNSNGSCRRRSSGGDPQRRFVQRCAFHRYYRQCLALPTSIEQFSFDRSIWGERQPLRRRNRFGARRPVPHLFSA